jgi:hypothetical protein
MTFLLTGRGRGMAWQWRRLNGSEEGLGGLSVRKGRTVRKLSRRTRLHFEF